MKVMETTWQTDPQDDSTPTHDRDQEVAHLRILTGKSARSVHEVRTKGISIGRLGSDSDVVIDDGRMSRRHARIERGTAGWRLQDLGSTNSGFVDGRGFGSNARTALGSEAVIRLGDTLMMFRTGAAADDGRADSPVFPGVSKVAAEVRQRMQALTAGNGHVLILGETGTGKERVARAFGEYRAPQPFVTLNAAELTRELARSELFGHVRGAFTNAGANKAGLVDSAGDGVLFLDEIGELAIDVQADLLRFLEDGSYRPVGSTELRRSNARLVAATHVDLDQAVQQGTFRRDLLARLRASNAPLKLPPLRERREDILDWTQLFFRLAGHDIEDPWTAGALECLLLYPWDENLRGLGSAVNLVLSKTPSFPSKTEHLPPELFAHRASLRNAGGRPLGETTPQRPDPTKAEIEVALTDTQGNMRLAARRLGIHRRKLYRLCERFGIAHESFRGEPERKDE
jgi:two-component system NtrC family response regulator